MNATLKSLDRKDAEKKDLVEALRATYTKALAEKNWPVLDLAAAQLARMGALD